MTIEEASMMFGVVSFFAMSVLFGYCLHLNSRLNDQSDWMMNHSAWLKAHSNWLKALTVITKNDLPDEINDHLSEFIFRTPEETILVSMKRSDDQWVNE